MKNLKHQSAKPSHYNKEADTYDIFNEENTLIINQTIEKTLKKHRVKSVLDLTCGTGSQIFYLSKLGYNTTGVDINAKMLSHAKNKANQLKQKPKIIKGDMRDSKMGEFDAVITAFNAIGHLTKADFKKTIKNVAANLKLGGVYIFDIFNLNYLLDKDNITKLTIDWQKKTGNKIVREIQYSTINHDGVLASYDIYYEQIDNGIPRISNAYQTLQVYSRTQLQEILHKNGFKTLRQCTIDGKRFSDRKSERVLTIAKKIST